MVKDASLQHDSTMIILSPFLSSRYAVRDLYAPLTSINTAIKQQSGKGLKYKSFALLLILMEHVIVPLQKEIYQSIVCTAAALIILL